mgnify:CR=1 FL=1
MKEVTIRCSGVPEHFNLPWKLAIEKGRFEASGIHIDWVDAASGTGAMCQDLRNGKTDMAILLTEGALRDIDNGNPSKICSFYVNSPLVWGVHAGSHSHLSNDFVQSQVRFAISRFTSGSHLMAYVYARQKGIALSEDQFDVVNDLDGARRSLNTHANLLFLWEKFTTKPLVDLGEFKRVDECPTPWPAFVVVARESLLQNHPELVKKVISIVQQEAGWLKEHPKATQMISERYGIEQSDAANWLSSVEWSANTHIDKEVLKGVFDTLHNMGLVSGTTSPESTVWREEHEIEVF